MKMVKLGKYEDENQKQKEKDSIKKVGGEIYVDKKNRQWFAVFPSLADVPSKFLLHTMEVAEVPIDWEKEK